MRLKCSHALKKRFVDESWCKHLGTCNDAAVLFAKEEKFLMTEMHHNLNFQPVDL